ncbi:MAG TPA: hypothetical protein ENK32_11825, partial [Anaerolineae bacterium]|nr:hypothetical protein [Anaerolineae bacterium]
MNRQTLQTSLIFALLILLFAACGGSSSSAPIASAPKSEGGTAVDNPPSPPNTGSSSLPAATYVAPEPIEEAEEAVDYMAEPETIQEVPAEESAAGAPIAAAPTPLATAPPANDSIAPEPYYPTPTPVSPANTFFEDYGVNPFILTQADPLSTFSLDVDTGSYSVARNYLRQGLQPPPDAIRPEEFVNAFDQGYDIPPDTAFAVYAD